MRKKSKKQSGVKDNITDADIDEVIRRSGAGGVSIQYARETIEGWKRMANQGGEVGRKAKEQLAKYFPSKKKKK